VKSKGVLAGEQMQNSQKSDSLISYIAATAPALLQLLAVLSIGLVNVLRFDQFVLIPNFINIANFLVVLLSISLISLASFWDYNKFGLLEPGESIFSQAKKFWRVLISFCALATTGSLAFVGIVLNKEILIHNTETWAFLQWATYIISMVSVSFIIYAFALLKIQEKQNEESYANYIPKLVDSLRRYGHVKDPDIVIESINRNELQAIVKLGGSSKYKVYTDHTGEMVSIQGIK
jgi:hypothetical protein